MPIAAGASAAPEPGAALGASLQLQCSVSGGGTTSEAGTSGVASSGQQLQQRPKRNKAADPPPQGAYIRTRQIRLHPHGRKGEVVEPPGQCLVAGVGIGVGRPF